MAGRFGPYNYERTLGTRNYNFVGDVEAIILQTQRRVDDLIKQSIMDVIDIAQTPGPSSKGTKAAISKGLGSTGRGKKRLQVQGPVTAAASGGKGGKMRVDTGFLRASGQLSLTGMPSGPVRGDKNGSYTFDRTIAETTLNGVTAGDTVFWGWTANYAKYREAYDGFLISAVQQWQAIVNKNAADIISRIK